MAITTYSDISFVLSGGTSNINPNAALGGEPSSYPIVDSMVNNLFNDVTPSQSQEGYEDYRCFYVFNDGPTTVYEVKIWVASEYAGGASVQLGIDYKNELQRITIGNVGITGGSFTLSYNGTSFIVNYDPDIGVWATNFQTAINNLLALNDVQIIVQYSSDSTLFDVSFTGRDGKRWHPALAIVSNNLIPETTIGLSILQVGSPINTSAVEIGAETNPPGGVVFYETTETSPIYVPRLDPEDELPIWVKRTTLENTESIAEDGFTFRFSAESLAPLS